MPKLYEYKGFIFFLYSNEHLPPHVHVTKGSVKIKVEFLEVAGATWTDLKEEKKKFTASQKRDIQDFVDNYREQILKKWDIVFVEKKKPKFEKIDKI
ncbi:MAG TPA: DUF4160 domain-containing protein [Chitinophagaceae bacterium]|nr:DUF4160 domain-containing protein [Chitinophagaceae bacterium]